MIILRRLGIVLAGFVASAALAGLSLILFFSALNGRIPNGSGAFDVVLIAVAVVATLTFIPALAIAAIAEFYAIRRRRYFVAASTVMALLMGSLLFWPGPRTPDPRLMLAIFLAGPVAGWVYWRVAGRTAGSWREARKPAP